jgi:hypothetical protein
MARGRALAADLAAVAAVALAAVALYRRVLGLFWLYDSPFHLRLLSQHRLGEFFLSRAPWLEEKNVFTPLFFASLAADRAVGGAAPAVFYAHQLAAIAICAVALYATLRLWIAPPAAAAGAVLFLVGPSVAATAPVLMSRHYFEALALASLSLGAYVRSLRRAGAGWAIGSALCYAAALLAKEIAAPAIVLAALLPEGDWRRRARTLAPHAVALAAYVAYRAAMLERPLAGHGWLDPRGTVGAALALPRDVFTPLFGASQALAAVLFLGVAAGLAALEGRALAAVGVTVLASLAAVVPVSFEMQPRFVIAAWLLLAGGAACGWSRLAGRMGGARAVARALAAATLLAAAVAGHTAWASASRLARRMSVENRAFVGLTEAAVLRHPASATSTLLELRAWRASPAPSAAWYQDDLFLCPPRPVPSLILGYDESSATMRDVTAVSLAAGTAACAAVDAALSARFTWGPDGLRWELGPYDDHGYSFVIDEGVTRIDVPRKGGYDWRGAGVRLRIRHLSAAGVVTYSPLLSLERRPGAQEWRR